MAVAPAQPNPPQVQDSQPQPPQQVKQVQEKKRQPVSRGKAAKDRTDKNDDEKK